MTLVAAAVATLSCVVIGVLFMLHVRGVGKDENMDRITAAWGQVLPLIRYGPLPGVLPDNDAGAAIQILDTHGKVISATRPLIGKPPMATFRPASDEVQAVRMSLCPPKGRPPVEPMGCLTISAYKILPADAPSQLVYVAVPGVPWYGSRTALALVLGGSALVIALSAAGTSRVVAHTLAPVDAIRCELAEITATGLDRRVPVPATRDEITHLAETANATLDRLEDAYDQLRRFTSDASHDLRSPITAMRTQLEEALLYPDDTEWAELAKTLLTGVERQQAIVTDLLALARLDAGGPLTRKRAELTRLVRTELARRTGSRVPIVEDLQPGVFIDCDPLRITRLLTNLLDNAERHADTRVAVTVRAEGSTAVLEVADDGAGIAPEDREMIFDRFTRLEASRSRDTGGTGLGLAIARQIAEAHEGTLTVEDSDRGARLVLRVPRDTGR
ncbi:MAG: sensor histidine kinase [Actinomadura sp.]